MEDVSLNVKRVQRQNGKQQNGDAVFVWRRGVAAKPRDVKILIAIWRAHVLNGGHLATFLVGEMVKDLPTAPHCFPLYWRRRRFCWRHVLNTARAPVPQCTCGFLNLCAVAARRGLTACY